MRKMLNYSRSYGPSVDFIFEMDIFSEGISCVFLVHP